MATLQREDHFDNVVDLFTGEKYQSQGGNQLIRLTPELDGLEMLYSNDHNAGRLFSMKILCWGLKERGEVIALVPWLGKVVDCTQLSDPLNGHWEGFYDSREERLFFDPPEPKVIELQSAGDYYRSAEQLQHDDEPPRILQELPDTIGTHAVLTDDNFQSFRLSEVVSWRLMNNGELLGMLVDETRISSTPVLPGDPCLYPAQKDPGFRYFFHHRIANKIKAKDPDALAAFAQLVQP